MQNCHFLRNIAVDELQNLYPEFRFLFFTYGAQNEVYNDDWVKSGLIVLCFS